MVEDTMAERETVKKTDEGQEGMDFIYKETLQTEKEKDAIPNEIVLFTNKEGTFVELKHLPKFCQAHIDMNGTRSSIINNTMNLKDMKDIVMDYQQYVGYLSYNAVGEVNEEINEALDTIMWDIHRLTETVNMHG